MVQNTTLVRDVAKGGGEPEDKSCPYDLLWKGFE